MFCCMFMCFTNLVEFLIDTSSRGPQRFLYAGMATQMVLRTKEAIATQKLASEEGCELSYRASYVGVTPRIVC